MSARRRVSLFVSLFGLGLCLIGGGCQLQIGFVDQSSKPPPLSQPETLATAKPYEPQPTIQQTSGYGGYAAPPVAAPPSVPPPVTTTDPALANNSVASVLPVGPHLPLGPPPGSPGGPPLAPEAGNLPTELAMRSHPPYRIEPPDILLIDTIRMVPRPPYVIGPLDVLLIRVGTPLPNQPVDGQYTVGPDGTVNLGYSYGIVRLGGLTLAEAERVLRAQMRRAGLADPQLFVGLAQYRGVQQARGEHLVRQDGTISLGTYGCVYVAGLTLAEAKVAIERHLSQYVLEPEITVDVFAYNSKYYYVIADGAGYGQLVYRFPIVGKETVLDAINNIGGIPASNSVRKVWVARPAPPDASCTQVLPVDWLAITQGGATGTNYQLFPGDRVYINANCLIKATNVIDQALAPIDRVLTTFLLGASIRNVLRNNNNGRNNNGTSTIGFVAPLP
jgi:polysaccharide export outer membrane protein